VSFLLTQSRHSKADCQSYKGQLRSAFYRAPSLTALRDKAHSLRCSNASREQMVTGYRAVLSSEAVSTRRLSGLKTALLNELAWPA
jgi:hypothetical protein